MTRQRCSTVSRRCWRSWSSCSALIRSTRTEPWCSMTSPRRRPSETQTLSTFSRASLEFGSNVVVHEMAHQWFGNSVTLTTWQDIWLHEAFATYSEWLWDEADVGPDALEASVRFAYGVMGGAAAVAQGADPEEVARNCPTSSPRRGTLGPTRSSIRRSTCAAGSRCTLSGLRWVTRTSPSAQVVGPSVTGTGMSPPTTSSRWPVISQPPRWTIDRGLAVSAGGSSHATTGPGPRGSVSEHRSAYAYAYRLRKTATMATAAVLGASGYAGGELVHLLDGHPDIELTISVVTPRRGVVSANCIPNSLEATAVLGPIDLDRIPTVEIVFLPCLTGRLPVSPPPPPSGHDRHRPGQRYGLDTPSVTSAPTAPSTHTRRVGAVGLRAPRGVGEAAAWRHTNRCPGCYRRPRCWPSPRCLLRESLPVPGSWWTLIGATGAGRSLRSDLLFGEVAEGVRPMAWGVTVTAPRWRWHWRGSPGNRSTSASRPISPRSSAGWWPPSPPL